MHMRNPEDAKLSERSRPQEDKLRGSPARLLGPTAAGSTGKAESRTEGAKGGGTGGVEGRR